MDYKYIKQLLDRYWKCETSLAEEDILRTFFSQSTVPSELLRYRELFTYGQLNKETDVLSDDFDERVLSVIDEPAPVKARTITMTHRLKPFFKAAAVVAIFLTLGNAAAMYVRMCPQDMIKCIGEHPLQWAILPLSIRCISISRNL